MGEPARLEWLAYYKSQCEEAKALELCVSAEEEAEVRAAIKAEEESRRLEWLVYHISQGQLKQALSFIKIFLLGAASAHSHTPLVRFFPARIRPSHSLISQPHLPRSRDRACRHSRMP